MPQDRRGLVLWWATFLTVLVALVLVFLYAPPDVRLGDTQRLFYFHVAAAWNGLLALLIVFISSLAYLRGNRRAWDRMAQASAEVGVLFVTMTLITGSVWARHAWGIWWEWEPRLTSAFVLWFLYVAALLVRGLTEDPGQKGRYAAVFSIVAFADVPVVFMSVRWWRSYHPVVVRGGGIELDPAMILTLVSSVLAFTLLYCYLVSQRVQLLRLLEQLAEQKRRWRALVEGNDGGERA